LRALRTIDDGTGQNGSERGDTMTETTALALPAAVMSPGLHQADRRARLRELEQVIETGWEAVVAVGLALREIRDERLYLELDGGLTFEEYVRLRWSVSPGHAYREIDAADVAEAISPMGETAVPIANERVGRGLAMVLHQGGPAKVAEAWSKVSDRYRDQRPPTAAEVHRVLVAEGYRPPVGRASPGKPNGRILLGQVGDRIAATEKRLDWFLNREAPGLPRIAANTRELAATYADRCEQLARRLRAFAEPDHSPDLSARRRKNSAADEHDGLDAPEALTA
jgi:hypothetical protein